MPFIAPFNGPSSSFAIYQDAQALLSAFNLVLPGVNMPPSIFDPDDIQLEIPDIITSLNIVLPSFSTVYDSLEANIPITNITLAPNSDNYIYINENGRGASSELNNSTYMIATSGFNSGNYGPVNPGGQYNYVQASAPISLGNNQPLTMQWTCNVHPSGATFGPGIIDINGNGIQMILAPDEVTVYYQANGVVQYIVTASDNIAPILAGNHTVSLSVQLNSDGDAPRSFNMSVTGYIDGNVTPIISTTIYSAFMNPFQVYPIFNFNYGSSLAAYVKSWKWYYIYGNQPLSWGISSVGVGSNPPTLLSYQLPVFIVSTSIGSAISVIDLTNNINIFTKLSYIEDYIDQITEAYT